MSTLLIPRRTLLVTTCTAVLLAAGLPAPRTAAAPAEVHTRFVLLSGKPIAGDDETGGSQGVLVVPGTVLRLGSRPGLGREDSEARGLELTELAAKLRRTLRLDDVQILYTQELALEIDREQELPPPTATSAVRIEVELAGFNDHLATYRVHFKRGSASFADSTLSVERGGRALVGGLDGAEAPYLFLMVEPIAHPHLARRVDEGISPPRIVERTLPLYTPEAKAARVQGVVILRVVIDEVGEVGDVQVLKGLPLGLEDRAVAAVRQWRFQPALDEQGKPVAVEYNLTISFRLDDGPATPLPDRP